MLVKKTSLDGHRLSWWARVRGGHKHGLRLGRLLTNIGVWEEEEVAVPQLPESGAFSDQERQKSWVYGRFSHILNCRKVNVWSIQPPPSRKPAWLSRAYLFWILHSRRRIMLPRGSDAIFTKIIGLLLLQFTSRSLSVDKITDSYQSLGFSFLAQIGPRSFSSLCLRRDTVRLSD